MFRRAPKDGLRMLAREVPAGLREAELVYGKLRHAFVIRFG
jgi:hypothetical protein